MDLLLDLIGMVAEAAKRVWPGVLAAALGGYVGWQWLGFIGFWTGAALGALAGTWLGARLGLVAVSARTGSAQRDQLLAAAGAFGLVAVGYLLLQFIYILIAIVLVIGIASAWLNG